MPAERAPLRRWLLGLLLAASAIGTAGAQEASLQTCLDAAADFSPVYPTDEFPYGTNQVTAVWQLGAGEQVRELAGSFVAVDAGAAAAPGARILQAQVALGTSRAGRFRFAQPGPFPPGRYRLEVTADGAPWRSAEFTIQPEQVAPPPPLAAVVPLTVGTIRHYDFTQEAGEGAHVALPDIQPGPDGKLHATVTYTVVGTDDAGAHLEMRRNDRLVLEEWWRIGPAGVAVTRRRAEGQLAPLQPPQPLLAWPPGVKSWDWPSPSASPHEHVEMWGPLPIDAGAWGRVPGYIVLSRTEQQPEGMIGTIERDFSPGLGLLREHTVVQIGPVTALRQDVALAPPVR
ncbi:MAG: carboxypeptidase regulatory-like domain-containing protein [Alphaproteobacteria bacterium]|nr:carboxypeptidase regulatory-like domain-containing protein [Alphaproteobacteria bacterium]